MRKLLLILVAGLSVLGIGAAIAGALESKDSWTPAATQFKAQAKSNIFVVKVKTLGEIENKCQLFQVKGVTPQGKTNPQTGETRFTDQTKINVGAPIFEGCTQSPIVGNGEWKVELHSQGLQKKQEEECKQASRGQYNAMTEDDDCITIIIPKNGFEVGSEAICLIKLAHEQPFAITGYYEDEIGLFTVNAGNIPALAKGNLCTEEQILFSLVGTFGLKPIITDDI